MTTTTVIAANARCGLGIDAGGTRTRWALAAADGDIIATGQGPGITALQVSTGPGYKSLSTSIRRLAAEVGAVRAPGWIVAGITGQGDNSGLLAALFAAPFGLPVEYVTVKSDIEIAYLDLFAPGEGYVVYAGTGSIAAYLDRAGQLHRAGGRGVLLDDGGGGYWIAREALRHIWRREDERPGSWRDSPMAAALFERIGGSDWVHSRAAVYGGERGDIGQFALAVAQMVDADPVARGIIFAAGGELARLALALTQRYGPRPIALAGRAAHLHPLIEESMRAALPAAAILTLRTSEAHIAAARIACRAMAVT